MLPILRDELGALDLERGRDVFADDRGVERTERIRRVACGDLVALEALCGLVALTACAAASPSAESMSRCAGGIASY